MRSFGICRARRDNGFGSNIDLTSWHASARRRSLEYQGVGGLDEAPSQGSGRDRDSTGLEKKVRVCPEEVQAASAEPSE